MGPWRTHNLGRSCSLFAAHGPVGRLPAWPALLVLSAGVGSSLGGRPSLLRVELYDDNRHGPPVSATWYLAPDIRRIMNQDFCAGSFKFPAEKNLDLWDLPA